MRRLRSSLLVACAVATASAEEPGTVSIERVDPAVCFDAAHLGARLKQNLDGAEVRTGPGGDITVVVGLRRNGIEVVVTRRSSGTARSERRTLPVDRNCSVLTDAVAAIVARIAAPLGARPASPPLPSVTELPPLPTVPAPKPIVTQLPVVTQLPLPEPEKPPPPPPIPVAPPPAPPPPERKSVRAPTRPEKRPRPIDRRPSETRVARATPPRDVEPSLTPPLPEPDPIDVVKPPPGPPRPRARMFLGAAFRYSVPLDGGVAQPGLLASLDVRIQRRWLLTVEGGFENAAVTTAGAATATLARYPFRAGAAFEQPIPSGGIRFGAGALLELWTARSDGVAHPDRGTALHPGVYASLAYHLRLGHWFDLFAGVDFEYTWVTETFVVDGLGPIATTPSYWLCPFAGASLNFF